MGEKTASLKLRQYSAAEREHAIQLGLRLGPTKASQQLGIPTGSISAWMSKHREQLRTAEAAPDEKPVVDEPSPPPKRAKRVAKVYTPSQKAEILEYADQHGVTAAHEHFGASRWTIYDWRQRVARAAKGQGDAPTSGPDPADVEAQRDREILDEWARHPGLGPSQIKNQLRRKGIKISTNTVRRVMLDAGYRPPKRKRASTIGATRPCVRTTSGLCAAPRYSLRQAENSGFGPSTR